MDSPNTPEDGQRAHGRPPFAPTEEQRQLVKDLATAGIPQPQICRMIRWPDGSPISEPTLRAHFRDELDLGLIEANAAVAGALFKQAMAGHVGAQAFWLKTRARWRETPQEIAFTDPDGNPVKPPTLADFYAALKAPPTDPSQDTASE